MKLRILATLAVTGAIAAAPASAVDVKMELALLVDVSGSVSATEFNL